MAVHLDGHDRGRCASTRKGRRNPKLTTVGFLCVLGAMASVEVFGPLPTGASLAAATSPAARQEQSSAGAKLKSPSAGHQQMLALLKQIAHETADTHVYIGDGTARRVRAELAALPAAMLGPARFLLQMRVAEEELRLGNEAEAIRHFIQARQLLPGSGVDNLLNYSRYRLGVAYMRLGETQNCTLHHTGNSCILPLRGDGIHSQQDPSRQAIASFTDVLANTWEAMSLNLAAGASTRSDSVARAARQQDGSAGIVQANARSLNLAARWLLNIAYMTIGGYPEQVPEPYLIPPRAFDSDEQIPRFNNIAPHLGLDTFDMSGGAIADDFDNDGYLDIVVSTWDTEGQIRLFANNQDGTFSERTEQAGLLGLLGGLNLVQADYDNDGSVDILVLRGAWLHENGQHPHSLLRNNGDGTFTDVTFETGLGRVHYPSQTASWGDYDNDGDLDLYIGNESSIAFPAPSQLFRNNGDSTFTDVAAEAGVTNDDYTKAVIWGDYDGDRWLDLYVSNLGGVNRLYRNGGDGTFTNVAEQLGVSGPTASFTSWFWDVDNDGALDLYVSAYAAGIEELAASALGLPVEVELARLYRGTGEDGFEEVARRYNLVRPNAVMGANFGDLDNDGYLDFYLGTGRPHYDNLMPGVMYRNRNGTGFADVTYAGGFGHLQKGHAVVFADLDHDGDQDVFEQMGGAFPGDRYSNVLYENPGFGNHWITVQLVGRRSNRSAIGVRVRAEVVEDGTRRSIYRHVNSGGSFGGNPLRQTIGLGRASRIEVLEVFWPTTGLTQTFHEVPVDQVIQITEGEGSYATIKLKTLKLGQPHVG